jgi:pentatricopeptide repeat protein
LLTTYAKCGALRDALHLFLQIPSRNVVSWNSLISGYAQLGLGHEALHCFKQMKEESAFRPNAVTFLGAVKACSSIRCAEMGEEIYAELRSTGLLEKNVAVGNAVLDMYAKCNMLGKARCVFAELPIRDVVTWNSMVSAYNQHGLGSEALKCFRSMQEEAILPDPVTYTCVLKACGSSKSLRMGVEIDAMVTKESVLERNILFGTALVDMYGKCGQIERAQEAFDELPIRNVASWTALMAGYLEEGLSDKALDCFMTMQEEGHSPDAVTFVSVLKACGSSGLLETGENIHNEISTQCLLGKDIVLGTALVDMYAKCGMLQKAQEVFDAHTMQSVPSYTALMTGYALLGREKRVFNIFREMLADGMLPDMAMFVVLLSACNHGGRVEEGRVIFRCSIPALELTNCMVNLFSGAGNFMKALELIEKVPSSDRLESWLSLLGACQNWTNVELAVLIFQQILQLNERCATAYVFMGNVFAARGMHKKAHFQEVIT